MSATSVNEGKKDGEDGEEEAETAAKKETDEISKKDVDIRRLFEEMRSTHQEEKQRLKEVSKSKKCFREKKLKRQQVIQRILEDIKGVSNIQGIKSAKKKVLIAKERMNEEKSLHHVKGLPMSLVNSKKIIRRQRAKKMK